MPILSRTAPAPNPQTAADWPCWTDEDRWVPSDPTPPDRFDDEAPGAELPDCEPELPDRQWWCEQLAHLESQRPNCLAMPETLAYLDTQIASTRRHLILSEVTEFISATRFDGHDASEDGGRW